MKLNPALSVTFFCLSVLGMGSPAASQEVHESFRRHIETLTEIDESTREDAQSLVESLSADSRYQNMAIVEGLLVLYPELSDAMDLMGAETPGAAVEALETLRKKKDPFLAAASTLLLGRSLIMEERYEQALPAIESVLEEYPEFSDQISDAIYFKGMCEASMLKNQDAIRSLTQFLENYPFAAERMRV